MEAKQQIEIFKQVATRWINNQINGLLGDGFAKQIFRPVVDELIERYSKSPMIDTVLSIFVDENGNFDIDKLLDRYIDSMLVDGNIRFKWGDLSQKLGFIDSLTGRVNVITAEDLKELKNSFLSGINRE